MYLWLPVLVSLRRLRRGDGGDAGGRAVAGDCAPAWVGSGSGGLRTGAGRPVRTGVRRGRDHRPAYHRGTVGDLLLLAVLRPSDLGGDPGDRGPVPGASAQGAGAGPGAAIKASEIVGLTQMGIAAQPVIAII